MDYSRLVSHCLQMSVLSSLCSNTCEPRLLALVPCCSFSMLTSFVASRRRKKEEDESSFFFFFFFFVTAVSYQQVQVGEFFNLQSNPALLLNVHPYRVTSQKTSKVFIENDSCSSSSSSNGSSRSRKSEKRKGCHFHVKYKAKDNTKASCYSYALVFQVSLYEFHFGGTTKKTETKGKDKLKTIQMKHIHRRT